METMETTENGRFNPFIGLPTVGAIETKLSQILSLSGAFFQESSDSEEMNRLAEEAIRKITKN